MRRKEKEKNIKAVTEEKIKKNYASDSFYLITFIFLLTTCKSNNCNNWWKIQLLCDDVFLGFIVYANPLMTIELVLSLLGLGLPP